MDNRLTVISAVALLLAFGFSGSAVAQLVGTDTAPGSSCAGVAQGATRMTADADQDGASVVLVCDGTTWNTQGVKVHYDAAACSSSKGGTIRYSSGGTPEWEYCDGGANTWRPFEHAAAACVAPALCPHVGDVCSDGSLFAGFMANPTDGSCRIIYVTDNNQSTAVAWRTSGDGNHINPDSYSDGRANIAHLSGSLTNYPALNLCDSNSYHGKSDWYLPAHNELALLWQNRAAINANAAGSFTTGYYWSSTEASNFHAWGWDFNAGYNEQITKGSGSHDARCIRSEDSVGSGSTGCAAPALCPNIGDVCADGTIFAGCHPSFLEPMFVTRCDSGRTSDGSACTGARTAQYWVNSSSASNIRDTGVVSLLDGRENTAALTAAPGGGACMANQPCDARTTAGVQNHNAAQYCANLDVHGHQDWYLPSAVELYIGMAHGNPNLSAVFDFEEEEAYWASTDHNFWGKAYWGETLNMTMGHYADKQEAFFVRCMRRDGP